MTCTWCSNQREIRDYADSPQFSDETFNNAKARPRTGFGKTVAIFWDFMFNKPKGTVPKDQVPVLSLTRQQLLDAPNRSLFRLGHSTILLKLQGQFYITDPVFAERASPFSWFGPKRFHAPPIALEDLPEINAVILSHNHYDHLDYASVRALAPKVKHFFTPLGVGDTLIEWGIDPKKVQQFDWWQGTSVDGIEFISTPAQHFSGRGLFDSNKTLWSSWVIIDGDKRLFFSGDTGYFDGFKEIGQRFGPFDLTLMETGAYNEAWPYVHMLPEQSLQAHKDLQGKWLLPIHNGTFDLSMHSWHDPFDQILRLANDDNIDLSTPQMGERLNLESPHKGDRWWKNMQ
ncbi:hypothetical protein TDB9533_03105 [Thalassocella blandensis]|nr:hypothetical protein TDB9533_03105 [Thalassocella blandensis]